MHKIHPGIKCKVFVNNCGALDIANSKNRPHGEKLYVRIYNFSDHVSRKCTIINNIDIKDQCQTI